jgi:2-amino-4-hydroxy-6-hydroxymethyldihydropteridine diphosphokinase
MQPRTFIAIGSSQADALRQAERAVERLGAWKGTSVVAVSPWFETTPVGPADSQFVNGVVEVSTSLPPLKLLDGLQSLERELGRQAGERWGPRAIDLDLLACGDTVIEHGRLQLPHPALWYRRFVLDPWEQIAADWIVPRWNMTVADLRQRLLQRPLPVRLVGGDVESRRAIADEMNDQFGGLVTITSGAAAELPSGSSDASDPLRVSLGYIPNSSRGESDVRWSVNLTQLAGDVQTDESNAAGFVLTAALDEPQENS